jgi:hypothetical protein
MGIFVQKSIIKLKIINRRFRLNGIVYVSNMEETNALTKFCKACGLPLSEYQYDVCDNFCKNIYWENLRKNENFHLEDLRQGKLNMTFKGKL